MVITSGERPKVSLQPPAKFHDNVSNFFMVVFSRKSNSVVVKKYFWKVTKSSFLRKLFLCLRKSKLCFAMKQYRSVILSVTLCLHAGCLSHCLARWTSRSSPWTRRGVRCNWRAVSVTSNMFVGLSVWLHF